MVQHPYITALMIAVDFFLLGFAARGGYDHGVARRRQRILDALSGPEAALRERDIQGLEDFAVHNAELGFYESAQHLRAQAAELRRRRST